MENVNKFKLLGVRAASWWACILVVLVINMIGAFFSWMFAPLDPVYVDYQKVDLQDFSSIEKFNAGMYSWHFNTEEEPDIIFDKINASYTDYKKLNSDIFSPFVLIVNENAVNVTSGFSVLNTEKKIKGRTIEKNLFNILEGIEQDKSWQDIGIHSDCLEGPIVLGVPDAYSPYRDKIKELFMINLSVKKITEENYKELEERAEKILAKCKQIENPIAYLSANKGNKVAIIAPEYILENDNDNIYRSSTNIEEDINPNFFVPVYLTRTNAIEYSIFVKNDLKEGFSEDISSTITGSTLNDVTGFRTKKNNFLNVSNSISGISITNIE